MALTNSRVQYFVVRATKDVFWVRDKNCCTVSFSTLTPKKSFHDGFSVHDLDSCNQINSFKISDKKYPATIKEKEIVKLLADELKLDKNQVLNEVMKHPKRKFLNVAQVTKTLKYLQFLGFSRQLIADLPAICFYPQESIKTSLKEISINSAELFQLGYVNGSVQNDTPGFLCGSKSKDKTLHLCLYYMELPFGFNGSGIFDVYDSDSNNRQTD